MNEEKRLEDKTFVPYIKAVSEELDQFTRRINNAYQVKKKNME